MGEACRTGIELEKFTQNFRQERLVERIPFIMSVDRKVIFKWIMRERVTYGHANVLPSLNLCIPPFPIHLIYSVLCVFLSVLQNTSKLSAVHCS